MKSSSIENRHETTAQRIPPRPAELVMSEGRAGASYPNALSFARNLLRKMCREKWRIETARLDLDADGRGEALYHVHTGSQTFHFFAISNYFPPHQKIDRAFGVNWDVSAAICQGEWTSEREARLRDEIPKQYDGRYDNDVLCFCRGNRSERIFDHVVERLAEGRQPDTALLATVGYLLRSTAFGGNGLFGIKPFAALGAGHPLGRTYDVQMLAAYLLRAFVFDLVDAMAAHRGAGAAMLDRSLKRYLGVGNSAGLGLIPFITNHPQIVNQWCATQEEAFAAALGRPACAKSAARFLALLERACAYFGAEQRDGNGVFADYDRMRRDLLVVLAEARPLLTTALSTPLPWQEVLTRITPEAAHAEVTEILLGLVLELHDDLIARYEARLDVEEIIDIDPAMSATRLATIARRDYGWLLERLTDERCDRFWYYPQELPYEPRRGMRGKARGYEVETSMDVPLKIAALMAALDDAKAGISVGELLAERPDLAVIAARVQSLQDRPYAELRMNSLSAQFSPFAACRFVLAFYGMEKYDPRLPRSTKGALMQGAPLIDELDLASLGDWPFPVPPDLGTGSGTAQGLPPLRALELPEISIKALARPDRPHPVPAERHSPVNIYAQEFDKLLVRICLGAGLPLACAEEAAAAALLGLACGRPEIEALLALLLRLVADGTPRLRTPHCLDAGGLPACAIAPRAVDLACGQARAGGTVRLLIENAAPSPLLFAAPIRAADRGFLTAVADPARQRLHVAGPGTQGSWYTAVTGITPGWAAEAARKADALQVICSYPRDGMTMEHALAELGAQEAASDWSLSSAQLSRIRRDVTTHGVPLPHDTLEMLRAAAMKALVPETAETAISP